MTSQRGSRGWGGIGILYCSKTDMRNELLFSNVVWLLILIFLSLLVHNVQIQILFDRFSVNDVITGKKVFKPNLNVSLTMGSDLISPIVLDIMKIWAPFDPILK